MSLFLIITLVVGIVLISLPMTFKPDRKEKDIKSTDSGKIEKMHNKKEAA